MNIINKLTNKLSSKTKKIILALLTIFIVIPMVLLLLLISIIDPNRYKETIGEQLSSTLNRKVELAGDLDWSLFPLGITIHDLTIANEPKFEAKYFLKSEEATISLELLPLIRKKFRLDYIYLKNTELNLAEDKKGNNNWESMFSSQLSSKPNNQQQTTQEANIDSGSNNQQDPDISIDTIVIVNTTINWQTPDDKASFKVINLAVKPDYPSFNIYGSIEASSKASNLFVSSKINSKVTLDNNKKNIVFNLNKLNIKNTQNNSTIYVDSFANNINIAGDIINSTSKLNIFNGQVNATTKINLGSKKTEYSGKIKVNNINMKQLLTNQFDSDSLSGNANLNLDYKTKGSGQQDLLSNLNGNFKLNLDSGTLNGVDINKLVALLDTQISTNPTEIFKTAKSALTFTVSFLENLVDTVTSANSSTPIGKLSASGTINNGVIDNKDFVLVSTKAQVDGIGSINLPKNTIKYTLKVHDLHESQEKDKINLPITISGDLSDPSYSIGAPSGTIITEGIKGLGGKLLEKVPALKDVPLDILDKVLDF